MKPKNGILSINKKNYYIIEKIDIKIKKVEKYAINIFW